MSIACPQYDPPSRPISPARLQANRRNARKSTGPRTPEGKARSAQNARKHWGRPPHSPRPHPAGICSDDPYVRGEDAGTFAMHAQEMYEALLPLTLLQKQEFPQMVALQWSILRAIDTEREIIEALAEADEPPCRTIARAFLASPNNNPIAAHARYVRAQNRDFWRRLREYDQAAQRPQPVDPREQWEWEQLQRERQRAQAKAATVPQEDRPGQGETEFKRTQTNPNEPLENGDMGSESAIAGLPTAKTNPRGGSGVKQRGQRGPIRLCDPPVPQDQSRITAGT